MGLALYPGSIKSQAESAVNLLSQDNESLGSALEAIAQFSGDESLKGAAWDSVKAQLNSHTAVVQGLICANEILIQEHTTLIGAVGDEDLVEDELRNKIESLQAVNTNLQNCVTHLNSCLNDKVLGLNYASAYMTSISLYQNSIQLNLSQIQELEEKLQKLYDIENQTSSLFDSAEPLYSATASGVSAIKSAWNPATGQFSTAGIDMSWMGVIQDFWINAQGCVLEGDEAMMQELMEALWGEKIGLAAYPFDRHKSITLLKDGVRFKMQKIGNHYRLQLTGPIVENLSRAELTDYLKKNILDVDWKKYDIKEFTRNGLKTNSKYFDILGEEELFLGEKVKVVRSSDFKDYYKTIKDLQNKGGNLSKGKISLEYGKQQFKESLNYKKTLDPSEFKKLDGLEKVGKGIGIAGDLLTVGANASENLFTDGAFTPTADGIQDTITDSAVDLVSSAGATAAGMAIGTFLFPGAGTAVGAAIGMVIDLGINLDIADVDNDGEKDSLVDMAKIGIDNVCDEVGSFFENMISQVR